MRSVTWQVIRDAEPDARGRLLAFITGSDRVPLDGYDPPFNITMGSDMARDALPKARIESNRIESRIGFESHRIESNRNRTRIEAERRTQNAERRTQT